MGLVSGTWRLSSLLLQPVAAPTPSCPSPGSPVLTVFMAVRYLVSTIIAAGVNCLGSSLDSQLAGGDVETEFAIWMLGKVRCSVQGRCVPGHSH